uniref:Uncharacterized protein n=1 Tax=Megaselia scalaris TaxID=36166 RepID=T1GPY0_MEGSC
MFKIVFVVAFALIACVASKPTVFIHSSPHLVDSTIVKEPLHHYSSEAYIAPYDGHELTYSDHYDHHYSSDFHDFIDYDGFH